MEALQTPIKKEVCSRQICFEDIPATASICSNIDGHTEAVHLVSDGDTQHLIDSMVEVLLAHQSQASALCRERYAPYLEALQLLITSIEGEKSDGGGGSGGGEERTGKKRTGEDETAAAAGSSRRKRRRQRRLSILKRRVMMIAMM